MFGNDLRDFEKSILPTSESVVVGLCETAVDDACTTGAFGTLCAAGSFDCAAALCDCAAFCCAAPLSCATALNESIAAVENNVKILSFD